MLAPVFIVSHDFRNQQDRPKHAEEHRRAARPAAIGGQRA